MRKRKVGLHSLAILAMAGFIFLAFSSGATTPATITTTSVETNGSKTVSAPQDTGDARVKFMPDPAQKPFTSLGLVFATTVTKIDENGMEISGQEGIVTLLLKEAQKLGGDDILNLRTDENTNTTYTTIDSGTVTPGSNLTPTKNVVTTKTITITGSAMAIKYHD